MDQSGTDSTGLTAGQSLIRFISRLEAEYVGGTSRLYHAALLHPSSDRLKLAIFRETAVALSSSHVGEFGVKSIQESRERLETETTQFQTAVSAFLSTIREAFNDSMPLSKLHDELLVLVFNQFQWGKRNLSRVLPLSGVCRRWRRVIANHAPYWAVVEIDAESSRLDTQLQLANLCLERSFTAPLRFEFQQLWITPSSTHAGLDILLSKIPQVRSLSLFLTQYTLPVFAYSLTNRRATNLESLSVTLQRSSPPFGRWLPEDAVASRAVTASLEILPIFGDDFPKLQKLCLSGFHAPWNSRIYENLTSLILYHMPALESWEAFLDALQRSPFLEVLHIEYKRPTPDQIPDPGVLSPVSLGHLSSLGLYYITPLHVRTFFANVSIPSDVTFDITVTVHSGDQEARIYDVLNCISANIGALFPRVAKLSLSFWEDHRCLYFETVDVIHSVHCNFIRVELGDPANSRGEEFIFESILDFFPAVTHLEFAGNTRADTPHHLGRNSRITTLTLSGGDTTHILQELLPGGYFSSLNRLILSDMPSFDDCCDIIQSLEIQTLEITYVEEDSDPERLVILARQCGIEVLLEEAD